MELYKQAGSAFYTADFTVHGRRVRKSTKQNTRAKAGEVAAEFLRQALQGEVPIRKAPMPTLLQFAESQFLPLNEGNSRITENTKRCYRFGVQLLRSQKIAGMRLGDIRPVHIDTIQTPGGPSTANTLLRTLRRIFHVAQDLDLLGRIPRFTLRKEKKRERLVDPSVEAKVRSVIERSKRRGCLNAGLTLMLDCGMRPVEVANLRIEDVSLELGSLYVSRSKTEAGKRHIPMTDRVKEALFVEIGQRTAGWLFPSQRHAGQPITSQAFTVAWRKAARKAGVSDDLDLYSARHTFGTDLMTATKNPFLVSKLMGHSSPSITARYMHHEASEVAGLMNDRNKEREERHSSGHSEALIQ
jgi:integrase